MKLPLPKNTIVKLTLVGVLLTSLLSVGLATQFPTDSPEQGGTTIEADAPTPNEDFTPSVQNDDHEEYDEHEEYEDDHDDHEEYGDDHGDEYEDDHDEYEEYEDDHDDHEYE